LPSFLTTSVTEVVSQRRGLQRVNLATGRRAYVLTDLVGEVWVGDRVVVNTTAVDLGLGTGGWDVVHWNLERAELHRPGPGHIMKLRYTSLQLDSGSAEETAGPDTADPALDGLPVVACSLHSQLAVAAAAYRRSRTRSRVALVITDSAALPLAFSDLVADLVDRGVVDRTITTGQAFGGDLEAVNLASGLRVAKGTGADAAFVGPGPGVAGTGTALGHSALEVASVVDAAALDGGRPVVALRYSDADERDRHRGVSHHTLTALARTHHRAVVAVPAGAEVVAIEGHDVVEVDVPDVGEILTAAGLEVTSMGRGPVDDPGFFRFAAAAGIAAAQL
jgi:hypothetical protein